MKNKYNGNVKYDTIKLVQEGKFDEAKKLMVDNHHNETLFISSIENVPPNDSILNFINSFEDPKWKHYVPFLNKESTLKFFEFAQQNHVNLFEKTNEHNDTRLIDLIKVRLIGSYGNNTTDFFKSITTETISKALLQEDTFLIVKDWLEKHVNISDYNNPHSATEILLDKLNTPGLISPENHEKIFTRNNFTKQLLDLNYKDAEQLFAKYSNLFSNKDELTDTRILLSFYNHGEMNEFVSTRFKNAIETKTFNPNYDLLHPTTKENIKRGEFGFSLLMSSPKYALLKDLLDNKLLPTDLYNSQDNDQEPTFFERFLGNNILNYKNKNNIEYFFNVLQEVEVLQNYGIEKKINLASRERTDQILEKFLGVEESRSFWGSGEKVKIDKDVEELAMAIGLHPFEAQKLIAFLDKRYNFSPDAQLEETKANDEKAMKDAWNNLMNQVVFTKELKKENTNKPKM